MDVLAAHFEGREPMRPGFSGANDKLYVLLSLLHNFVIYRLSFAEMHGVSHEAELMIVLYSLLGILSDLDMVQNRD
jgi:hypothetical protein